MRVAEVDAANEPRISWPHHANTEDKPLDSIRGPTDGRYKMAFIELGDQGSALDESQRAAALSVIHKSERPLLFCLCS